MPKTLVFTMASQYSRQEVLGNKETEKHSQVGRTYLHGTSVPRHRRKPSLKQEEVRRMATETQGVPL